MAPNKFASMVHRNTNRLTLVLVYVLLEWILIAFILFNSLFSYLIVKYADYFGLKRPCVLCSRVDHGEDKRVRKDMICEEHALEISELGCCKKHQGKRNKDQSIEQEKDDEATEQDMQQLVSFVLVGSENDENVSESLIVESHQYSGLAPDTESDHVSESFQCSDYVTEIEGIDEAQKQSSDGTNTESEFDAKLETDAQKDGLIALDQSSELASTIEKLTRELNEAYAELEQEKNDAADASSQTMRMINKLQEEKAALHLEVLKYQKTTDEQIANEAGLLLDEPKLEVELETEHQENGLSASSTIEELTRALNEAYAELEQERNDIAEASSQTMAMITKLQEEKAALQLEASQYQRMTDEQIAFDEEAVLLLNEMVRKREKENQELEKELDSYKRRFAEQEKLRRSDEHYEKIVSESVSVCCSSFGDQESDGVSTEDDDHHVHHHNDPFIDFEDERLTILDRLNELEQKLEVESLVDDTVEENSMKCGIEEEDKEFLRKCMKTVKKADEGLSLVEEILQHLRALRRLEIS